VKARAAVGRVLIVAVLVAFGLGLVTSSRDFAFPVRLYLGAVAGYSVFEAVRWWRLDSGSGADRAERGVPPLAGRAPGSTGDYRRPSALVEWEAMIEAATGNARAARVRLAPRYREVARHVLVRRDGIDLETQPDLARVALGEDGWRLGGPAAGPVPGPTEPGLPFAVIERAVAALDTTASEVTP
jgi:hypothetical protein